MTERNLQHVYPATPAFYVNCCQCGVRVHSESAYADLAAAPGTYYCPACVRLLEAASNSKEGA